MPAKTNFFVTGATGYIGGSVLDRLLNHPNTNAFNITALVRSPEKAEKLESLGVKTIVASYSDLGVLEKQSSEADVVITMADADDVPATVAILSGLRKRHEATSTIPILIHTSGTGVLADREAAGLRSTEVIYDDADADQIATLGPERLHRPVDLLIEEADTQGYVRTYIILPSMIYGMASGRLVDLGIQNPHSVLIPALIKVSLQRGAAGAVGLGKNVWPHVDIDEVADLYIILYDAIVAHHPSTTPHGREGYFFGENGEFVFLDIARAIGQAMFDLGKVTSPEPTPFTSDEVQKYFTSGLLGSNSRCRATRSRALGWKPAKTTEDMLASIRAEVEALTK